MKISVVIAVRSGSRPVLNALGAIDRLIGRSRLEIILVNCCGTETDRSIRKAFPDLPVYDFPATSTLLEARCAGVMRASGDPVICLHERYAITEEWLGAIEREHREGADVVGGVLVPAPNLTTAEWSMYISEYSHITAPVPGGVASAGESTMLPFGNISYTKRALSMCAMWKASSEAGFAWDLCRAGARIVQSDQMKAEFSCSPTIMEYLTERRQVSRDYARLRASNSGPVGRVAAAIARLLLPPLLTTRILRNSRRRPLLKEHIWRALPFVVIFTFVQMAAEIQEYLISDTNTNRSSAVSSHPTELN